MSKKQAPIVTVYRWANQDGVPEQLSEGLLKNAPMGASAELAGTGYGTQKFVKVEAYEHGYWKNVKTTGLITSRELFRSIRDYSTGTKVFLGNATMLWP